MKTWGWTISAITYLQVKSKTVAQCVEYYYTWKKILRWGRKHRTRLEKKREECMVSREDIVSM